MHARQLAEIGGWLAVTSEILTRASKSCSSQQGMRYWAASKCRLQRWQSALKVFENDLKNPAEMHDPWPAIQVVIQEILFSDLLTRIWTTLLIQHDRAIKHPEMQSIGHSIYIGHVEARNRALRLIIRYRGVNEAAFDQLDEVRRRIERWTDMLLSRISNLDTAAQFGFDENRIRGFAADRPLESHRRRKEMEQILLASLISCLHQNGSQYSANPDLNREIACGVLECLPTDRFDSTGLPKSILMLQMEQVQNDTQQMVQSLIDEEENAHRVRHLSQTNSKHSLQRFRRQN